MLRSLRHSWRLIRSARTLARHDALFLAELAPIAPWQHRLLARVGDKRAKGRPGERLAQALVELGPSFVKLGQSLATRADILGERVAADLATLQDRLEPFPAAEARAIIEADLEAPVETLFASFTDQPVAAASIAQVHFATTPDGDEVAVKVLRPGIERLLERDLDFFLWLAERIERWVPSLRRYRPVGMVQELAATTRRELDLRLEAAAAAEFAQNCAEDPGFRVPRVDWRRTGRRVVTFERITGVRSDDIAGIRAMGLEPDRILETASVVFFNQVFRDGYFHGDMHPGNTMIEADGTIVALDFGIMGRISLERRRQLAQILVGFLERDYGMVTDSFVAAGFLPEHADLDGFRLAVRAIGEPIMDRPLAEISFGRLLGQILGVAERFEMRALPELLLLQKTMVVAEGVGRGLNPNVNMWQIAQPLVADWMVRNLGPAARLQAAAGDWLEATARLPELVARADRALAGPAPTATVAPPPRAVAIGLWAVAAGLFILALAIVTMGS